jgi:hypothetical protein
VLRTRPTWDIATDDQILEEVDAVVAAGYTHIFFTQNVKDLLIARGLWPQIVESIRAGTK